MTEPSNARSALNLRLVLAAFGLVLFTALAVVASRGSSAGLVAAFALLAVVALVDLVVVQRRRRAEQPKGSSLFE